MKSRTFDTGINPSRLIVVTDLDGTLLDFDDYSFDAARPALNKLKKLDVPVICCSSKTSREIEYWRRKLGLSTPFISENGSAVFFPIERFRNIRGNPVRRGHYMVHELGMQRERLRRIFERVRREEQVEMIGFSDMELKTVKSLCGFKTIQQAGVAADREYSEPFVFGSKTDEATVNRVLDRFKQRGLKVIRGKRFFHLVGDIDKGRAVELLQKTYEQTYATRYVTVGIGDSRNDLEMLQAVDVPILVMGKNRRYNRYLREKVSPILAGAPGPHGWRRALGRILRERA